MYIILSSPLLFMLFFKFCHPNILLFLVNFTCIGFFFLLLSYFISLSLKHWSSVTTGLLGPVKKSLCSRAPLWACQGIYKVKCIQKGNKLCCTEVSPINPRVWVFLCLPFPQIKRKKPHKLSFACPRQSDRLLFGLVSTETELNWHKQILVGLFL